MSERCEFCLNKDLSRQDQFAMAAMQGILAGRYSDPNLIKIDEDWVAVEAVKNAKSLIVELDKEE